MATHASIKAPATCPAQVPDFIGYPFLPLPHGCCHCFLAIEVNFCPFALKLGLVIHDTLDSAKGRSVTAELILAMPQLAEISATKIGTR